MTPGVEGEMLPWPANSKATELRSGSKAVPVLHVTCVPGVLGGPEEDPLELYFQMVVSIHVGARVCLLVGQAMRQLSQLPSSNMHIFKST